MKKRILIVEDNVTLSQIIRDWLKREGYAVATAIDEPFAHKRLRKEKFDLILSDVRLPQGNGIALLEWNNKEKMDILFVIMTEYASVTDAVKVIKMGVKDYLAKPVFHEQLVEMVKEFPKPVSTVRSKEKELFKRTSPKAKEAMNMAELVAPSDISVLILGANGTGKESIVRTIHFHCTRKDKPFVAVNCGAIPHELVLPSSDTQRVHLRELMPTREVVLKLPMAVRSSLMRLEHCHTICSPHCSVYCRKEHLCLSAQVQSV